MNRESAPMKVAVLMGGSSEERGVSLASGCEVAVALRSAGHDVISIDTAAGVISAALEQKIREAGIGQVDPPPSPAGASGYTLPDAHVIATEPVLQEVDVAFLALHGGAGEDGTIQTLLELAGVPYAGSGPVGCALAMDKDVSKRLMRDGDVATPKWLVGRVSGHEVEERLGLPVIVKPVSGGSSVRLTLARSVAQVDKATELAAGGGDTVMYESYIEGREFTVGVVAGKALPVVQIEPVNELFDFESKYATGMAREIAPAKIPPALSRQLKSLALDVHDLLRQDHFSRVDFIVDEGGQPFCLEANALPGLTRNSLLPKAAAAQGITFPDLCEQICRLGCHRGTLRDLPPDGEGKQNRHQVKREGKEMCQGDRRDGEKYDQRKAHQQRQQHGNERHQHHRQQDRDQHRPRHNQHATQHYKRPNAKDEAAA